jgi:hypothetical protein
MTTLTRRLALGFSLALACVPAVLGARQQDKGEFKTQSYSGKVQPLAPFLEKQGVKLDADAAEHLLALVAEDGKVYPLLKDEGCRMFFKDKTLLNRPMRLTGRVVGATQFLQVVSVQSVIKGKLHDVNYWCDVCSITTYEPGNCPCCGDPTVLKEEPVK